MVLFSVATWLDANVWFVLALVAGLFIVVEFFTQDFTALLLGIGTAVASLASALGAPLWLALLLFMVTAGALLVFARPPLRKWLEGRDSPNLKTSIERMVGAQVVAISPDRVRVVGGTTAGDEWSARDAAHVPLHPTHTYRVQEVVGSSLLVTLEETA